MRATGWSRTEHWKDVRTFCEIYLERYRTAELARFRRIFGMVG